MNERDQKVLFEIKRKYDLKKKPVDIYRVAKDLEIPQAEIPIICDRIRKAGHIEYAKAPGAPEKVYAVPML